MVTMYIEPEFDVRDQMPEGCDGKQDLPGIPRVGEVLVLGDDYDAWIVTSVSWSIPTPESVESGLSSGPSVTVRARPEGGE